MNVQSKILKKRSQIRFIRRDRIRTKIQQYILLAVMTIFVYQELVAIFTPYKFTITNPAVVTADAEASGIGSSALNVEHVGEATPQQSDIETIIRKEFGDQAEEALKVFTCESQLQHDRIGDESLTFIHNGQVYGRSIGIAQIRTGGIEKNGKIWVRSENVKEFEEQMKDPKKNIEMAKKIHNSQDWYGWYNCSKRVGVI